MKQKEVFTTGEVARICNVAPRTVSKWFDTGKLKGYRIPGSRDRRIPANQLVKFMRIHGMPMNGLEGSSLRVLVVDDEPDMRELLRDMLAVNSKYEVHLASNGFEAGMLADQVHPHVILLDLRLADVDGQLVCRNIRANPTLAATKVIAVSGQLTTRQGEMLLGQGFDGYLPKPFTQEDVIHMVEQASNVIT